jgi:hypothetical protein
MELAIDYTVRPECQEIFVSVFLFWTELRGSGVCELSNNVCLQNVIEHWHFTIITPPPFRARRRRRRIVLKTLR